MKNADKETVVLEKKGDGWEITAPTQAKANQADVRTLLDSLKDLKVTEAIERSAANYDKYDLGDAKGVHFIAYKGADKALDLVFGTSGTRGQMMRVAGKDGVFIATGYQSFLYTKEAKGWRDKSIAKFEDVNAVSVEIDNAQGKYSFTKNDGKWTGTFVASPNRPAPKDEDADKKDEGKDADKKDAKKDGEKKDGDKKEVAKKDDKDRSKSWEGFDGAKVDDLLRAYKNLSAIDFADAGAETGLDAAAKEGGIVRIKLKDGAGDYTILVGKTQKGKNRFAKREGGDDTVYVISSWAAEWATAEPSKFEKKEKDGKDEGDDSGDEEPGEMPPGFDLQMPPMPEH
jgi:hypothetical protein